MAGKMCDGDDNNIANFNTAQAFCDGRYAKTLETNPTNPHPADTPEFAAFARGVTSKTNDEPDGCCAATGAPVDPA